MKRRLYPTGTGTSDSLLAHGINTGIQNKVRQKRGKHIKHNAAQDSYRKAGHCKKQSQKSGTPLRNSKVHPCRQLEKKAGAPSHFS